MKFSSYTVVPVVVADDTFLIHQDSSNAEKRITAEDLAISLNGLSTEINIAGLRAVSVSGFVTGARKTLYGYTSVADGGGGVFYYDSVSALPDNGGTVIRPNAGTGRWLRPATKTINVRAFGAVGDGSTNDTNSVQAAINWAATLASATVYLPAGVYKITSVLTLANTPQVNISFIGDGSNVSIINQSAAGQDGLMLNFLNVGSEQPFRADIKGLGFTSAGIGGTALKVSFGDPAITINHRCPALSISDVTVKAADDANCFLNGIDITSPWNCHLTDVFVAGSSQGGVWANLTGDGIAMHGVCVNSHLSNVQASFFLNGFHWSKGALVNGNFTEGLFLSNCSFAQNRRGVYVEGDAALRVSTVRIQGGLIETRAGIAGVHLLNVQDFGVTNVAIVPEAVGAVIGVLCDTCSRGEISGNQFSSMLVGVKTINTCSFINVDKCIYRGTSTQVWFGAATSSSCSSSNGQQAIDTQPPLERNDNIPAAAAPPSQLGNRIYVGCGYGAKMFIGADQATTNGTDLVIPWDSIAGMQNDLAIWDAANPERLVPPPGCTKIRVNASIRWGAQPPITAGSFVTGEIYTILSVGTTNFTAIGAGANTVGVAFVASGAGAGTGTAVLNTSRNVLIQSITPDLTWAECQHTSGVRGSVGDGCTLTTGVLTAPFPAFFRVNVNQKSTGNLNIIGTTGAFPTAGWGTSFSMEVLG